MSSKAETNFTIFPTQNYILDFKHLASSETFLAFTLSLSGCKRRKGLFLPPC
jgi:hypothetical protein